MTRANWNCCNSPATGRAALLALLLVVCGCSEQLEAVKGFVASEQQARRRQRVELRAYSIVVPRQETPLLLHGVARLVDAGMDRGDIVTLQKKLDAMKVGDVHSRKLAVTFDGEPMELEIQVFLDREGEPELFFFAPEALHGRIARHGKELKAMLREQQRDVREQHLVVEAR